MLVRLAEERNVKLVTVCVECGLVAHMPFDDGQKLSSRRMFREHGWVLSLIDPKEKVLAPLCGPCAEKVYPPELLAHIKKEFA